MINEDVFGDLTEAKVVNIIASYRKGGEK